MSYLLKLSYLLYDVISFKLSKSKVLQKLLLSPMLFQWPKEFLIYLFILWQPLVKMTNRPLSKLISWVSHGNYKRTWQIVTLFI